MGLKGGDVGVLIRSLSDDSSRTSRTFGSNSVDKMFENMKISEVLVPANVLTVPESVQDEGCAICQDRFFGMFTNY